MVKLEEAIKTSNFSSPQHKALLNLLYTSWWLKTLISQELKKIGLTTEQYNVLRILKGKHPQKMCVRDIGSRMIEPNSNVPRIVDRLVTKKLVARATSDVDKRETVITLTDSGIAILKIASKKVEELFAKSVDLSSEDAIMLNNIMETLRTVE